MSIPVEDRRSDRRWKLLSGWTLVAASFITVFGLLQLPTPWVIEEPGNAYNTLGLAMSNGEEVPIIQVPSANIYPTDGSLNLLTVRIIGAPGNRTSWWQVITAMLDPAKSVVPVEEVYPSGQDSEEIDAQNQQAMEDSKQNAIAAALIFLGYEVDATFTVTGLIEDSPNIGILQEGDVLFQANGIEIEQRSDLTNIINETPAGTPLRMTIAREEAVLQVQANVREVEGRKELGIYLGTEFDFPVQIQLKLDNVGGPSAGMMFTLGIIEKLTEGSLTGGANISGTGTIQADGTVGKIGGTVQKMYAAIRGGSSYFLLPSGNCEDAVGNIPNGLTVIPVDTIDEAVESLQIIARNSDLSTLPTCQG
ncbi:MAG: ATP-dependent serine peptidase containing a PDZ domain protein [Microbacteriaceae bacterium]|nr:ATP-dependent serine peptidase containing a PDZ domain protein [Microbacteriaceae bacterium]